MVTSADFCRVARPTRPRGPVVGLSMGTPPSAPSTSGRRSGHLTSPGVPRIRWTTAHQSGHGLRPRHRRLILEKVLRPPPSPTATEQDVREVERHRVARCSLNKRPGPGRCGRRVAESKYATRWVTHELHVNHAFHASGVVPNTSRSLRLVNRSMGMVGHSVMPWVAAIHRSPADVTWVGDTRRSRCLARWWLTARVGDLTCALPVRRSARQRQFNNIFAWLPWSPCQ